MGLYFGNNKITGVHFGTVGAGGTTITLSAPTLSLNSNTGVVTATVTQGSSGYLTASSTSNTLSLTTQAATTITPTKSTQTAVAAGKYTLGAVTVAAIPSNYIIPSGTLDIITNGTHTVTNYASVSVNVPTSGATPTLQTKTATPTESTQMITADSGYDGLDSVEIEAISSTYVGSGVTRKAATTIYPATYSQTAAAANVYTTGVITVAAVPFTEIEYQGVHQDENGYLWPGIATNILRNSRSPMTYYGNDGAWDSGSWSVRSGGNGTGAACSGINANLDGIAILNNTSGNRDVYQKSFPYTPNATYTASFYAKMADSCTKTSITAQLRIWNDTTGKNHSGTTKTISSKTDWTLISLTFVMPASGVLAFMAGISGAGAIDMSAFQLKSGVGVTEWAPSSYDFTLNSSGIDSIEINNATFDYVSGFKVKDTNDNTLTYIRPNGTYPITTNGLYNIATYENVTVNVPTGGSTINNQNKTVNPTESQQQITADSGYTGLGTVTISPISSTYIGSSILENSSTDLIVSDGTVTAPAGYYAADASASVATMTLPTAVSSTRSYTNKLTINRSTSVQYLNIPVGYNTTAASYTISAVANGSVTAPSTISGTTATVTTGTNTLTLTKTISVTPNVTTAGYISSGTAGNSSVSLTANITTKAAATITPGTSNQTIEAGTYLTGAQTISGDADLVAGNIKSGVNIFGVTGTYTGEAGLDTSDATATAADLLYNKTAYVDGSKITGTMPNNGATGGTITTQGGTYTIPAGYTSGGTVTANLTTGSTTAANISGAAFEESTGDYGFRASVQIQPGYYSSATTITKEFSTILPAPETEGTSAQVLAGYDLYNHDGQVISGTMTNNSIGTITLDQTTTSYTIPAGYHNGTGKVQHITVDIPDPTISINSSTGVITASGSWTRGFTTDNSYSKTYNLTTLGATTYNVSASNQTISSGRYLTGNQTIRAVTTSNITAANIKAGVTVQVGDSADTDRILGVTGTFTSDANATAADINSGATAYVNGNKITGTQTFSTIHTGSSAPSSSLGSNGDVYLVLV